MKEETKKIELEDQETDAVTGGATSTVWGGGQMSWGSAPTIWKSVSTSKE